MAEDPGGLLAGQDHRQPGPGSESKPVVASEGLEGGSDLGARTQAKGRTQVPAPLAFDARRVSRCVLQVSVGWRGPLEARA